MTTCISRATNPLYNPPWIRIHSNTRNSISFVRDKNAKFALNNDILFDKGKHLFYIKYSIKLKYFNCWCSNIFVFRGDLACNIALDAVRTVVRDQGDRKEIDIKNYAKVEKVSDYLKHIYRFLPVLFIMIG